MALITVFSAVCAAGYVLLTPSESDGEDGTIPERLRRLGSAVFRGCPCLEGTEVPEGLEWTGVWVFDQDQRGESL